MTSEELIKKLSRDKAYQEIKRLKDLEIKRNQDLLAKEYKQFSSDCKKLGYSLETAWDLIMVEESYSDLIPILMNYLAEKNHSPKFREGIARALILNKDIGNDRNALLDSIQKMKGDQKKRVIDYAKSDLQLKINLKNIK